MLNCRRTCLAVLLATVATLPLCAQGGPPATATASYTNTQAERGEQLYRRACGECHEIKDHANPDFRFKWNGRSVASLFDNIRNTMPDDNPGSLTRQEYADIVAYLMKSNGMPSGPRPLAPDAAVLSAARIEMKDSRQR